MTHFLSPLELWGGVECTVNRVNDTVFDQLNRSGHRERTATDLAAFAALGLKTLRVALHWEKFADLQSWDWADLLITEMQRLSIRPIVGFLHHGSGPLHTNLLDPEFAQKLAAYALQVATRYPEVLDYTPVNEPQTTGRFSTLYGHWYPHHHSMRSYVRALYNQIKGIVLSMRAVRSIQPQARLIHTEDGGETFATPALEAYRVEREHRRWLGTDLLCGLVTRDHALYDFFLENGLTAEEVLWFTATPCPPTILGLNYYVTSDRFLDHRLQLYPSRAGGDTGTEPLVDIEAVRVRTEGIAGAAAMLKQAWSRYHLPLALTEAHLGSDPLEQTRWLAEIWRGAEAARAEGADVRAITVWALLGSYNWCHLCTQDSGAYEAGVFDLSRGHREETPLTDLVRRLANDLPADGASAEEGWWRRPDRITIPSPHSEDSL